MVEIAVSRVQAKRRFFPALAVAAIVRLYLWWQSLTRA